jgi:hypothetical protein
VMATRYSWFLTSLGTPILIDPPDVGISLIMPRTNGAPANQVAGRTSA